MKSTYDPVANKDSEGKKETKVEIPPPSNGPYNKFQTIDWLKDFTRDRKRYKDIHYGQKSIWSLLYSLYDSSSGWICVLLVGTFSGLTAAVVDISSAWMFDLKMGICKKAFWLNIEQCCWLSNSSHGEDSECHEWYSWSRLILGNPSTQNHYLLDYGLYILWAMIFSWLAVRFVLVFAPYATGSGIPEIKTILSGFIIRGYLGKWTLLIKSVGMILAVSAGLCLGKEGPMIHMAVCWGNFFAHLFPKYGKNEAKKREILSASVAAGIAVAFAAPVGGVLFSLEEASYYFPLKTMFRSFFCTMVAANIVRLMNPFGNENMVMFNLDYGAQWHAIELIPFAMLGVFGGIFGIIFNKANPWIVSRRKTSTLGKYPSTEVVVVAIVTAIISFPQLYMRLNSNDLIKIMTTTCGPGDNITLCDYNFNLEDFKGNSFGSFKAGPALIKVMGMLGMALTCKIILSTYSFAMKVPCGLFIPSLVVGSIMGRMLGVAMEQLVEHYKNLHWVQNMCKSNEACIYPGLYAIVGAAACLGGTTRITVSLVVIMLEVTGGSSYILPLMVATMFSKWTGDRFTDTIYIEFIKLNKFPFLNMENQLIKDGKAQDIMTPHTPDQPLKVITKDSMTVKEIHDIVKHSDFYGFPIIESKTSEYVTGIVTKCDIQSSIERIMDTEKDSIVVFSNLDKTNSKYSDLVQRINLTDILDPSPVTLSIETPLETVFEFFIKLGIRQIIVTDRGILRGIITKKDILIYTSQKHELE